MAKSLEDAALAQFFTQAHTHISWQDKAIPTELLEQLYEMRAFFQTTHGRLIF